MTQHQLQELLETEPARTLLEGAEERGYVLPTELEAFALEHDLADDEVELLTRELETTGLEIRETTPEAESDQNQTEAAEKAEPAVEQHQPQALVGAADSLQLFLADIGRHKLLTAAEEVMATVIYGAFFISILSAMVDIVYARLDPRIRPT